MRKTLLMSIALVVCAYADVSVYDYKATFKRIEPVVVSNNGNCFTCLRTVRDVIRGYLIINDCKNDCGSEKTGMAYLYRTTDKKHKDTIWKISVVANTSFYGKNFRSCTPKSEIDDKLSKLDQCNVSLVFDLRQPVSWDEPFKAGDAECCFIYGFLGWMNVHGRMVNHGFGTAMVKCNQSDFELCGDVDNSFKCLVIKGASGSMTGNFGYSGVCGTTGAINDCGDYIADMVISGNWVIKFNSKKTLDAPLAISEMDGYIVGVLRKEFVFDASEQH